jgi:hypothetical protein
MNNHPRVTGLHYSFREAACVVALLLTFSFLTACSTEHTDDLAVEKLPLEQQQATNFLPLNPDKPGTPVDVQRYLVPNKYTIVAYLSPYDDTSVSIEPKLIQLTQARNDIALRTVNINRPEVQGIDWQSPIIQAAEIQTLPFFQIYDPAESLRAQGRPASEQINQWIQ